MLTEFPVRDMKERKRFNSDINNVEQLDIKIQEEVRKVKQDVDKQFSLVKAEVFQMR